MAVLDFYTNFLDNKKARAGVIKGYGAGVRLGPRPNLGQGERTRLETQKLRVCMCIMRVCSSTCTRNSPMQFNDILKGDE